MEATGTLTDAIDCVTLQKHGELSRIFPIAENIVAGYGNFHTFTWIIIRTKKVSLQQYLEIYINFWNVFVINIF